MGDELYEVLIRNQETKNPITLIVKDIVVSSTCQLIFEGIRIKKPGDKTDKVTFTRILNSAESVEVPSGTYGAFRAAPKAPRDEYSANFKVYKPDGTGGTKYEWPSPVHPIPDGTPHPVFPDDPTSTTITAEQRMHRVQFEDVLIVGSGPLGATYARKIIEHNMKSEKKHGILMLEVGAQESKIPGENQKNAVAYQLDIDSFVPVIQGALSTLSIPVEHKVLKLDPISWPREPPPRRGQNPDQKARFNLGAAAATRCVGGMSTHWTCAIPRQHEVERWEGFDKKEWEALYEEGEIYFGLSRIEFDDSIRQVVLKEKLVEILEKSKQNWYRKVESSPLACKRSAKNKDFVTWAAANTILGDHDPSKSLFRLSPHHLCTKVLYAGDSGDKTVVAAVVQDMEENRQIHIFAKQYVICGGAVLTPQLLFNSGFRPVEGSLPALGCYLTEQIMTFCQIILKEEIIHEIEKDERWKEKREAHKRKNPDDPLPIPFNDPDPQITIPVSKEYPWHTQLHRDAFSYGDGDVAKSLDTRIVADFRLFGKIEPEVKNYVKFSTEIRDLYDMPQPTFHYALGSEDKKLARRMMEDMCNFASQIGDYLPNARPQFLEPGLALHLSGTTRAGKDIQDSVVNENSKVHGVKNLWIGSCSVIPTGASSSPTLTAVCFALKGARALLDELNKA